MISIEINKEFEHLITQDDIEMCKSTALDKYGDDIHINITVKDGYVGYTAVLPPIRRARRITGYLVGDLGMWNNAKLNELKERVKHNKSY